MGNTSTVPEQTAQALSEAENARRLRGLRRANGIGQWLGYRYFRATVVMVSNLFMQGKIVNLEALPQPHPHYYPPRYRRLKDQVISPRAFVIAPNHQHVLDIPLTGKIRRPMIWPSKPAFVRWWWLKHLNQAMGCAPFMRDVDWVKNPHYAKLAFTKDEVKWVIDLALLKGQPAVVYPQGTRRDDGVLSDSKLGAMYAAMRADVPLVPLAIYGLTKGDDFLRTPILRRRRVVAVVMPPLYPADCPRFESESELARALFDDWVQAIERGRRLAQKILAD